MYMYESPSRQVPTADRLQAPADGGPVMFVLLELKQRNIHIISFR